MIFAITVAASLCATAESISTKIDLFKFQQSSQQKIKRDLISNSTSLFGRSSELASNFDSSSSNRSIDGNLSYLLHNCDPELDFAPDFGVAESVFLALTLGVLIAVMIVGNILVILAILMERELQRAQYYLVLSLAVADLMVGVVVSPLAALYDIHQKWHLGVPMCDFYILSDVLACTSSILHLVAIALDRYWSITDVSYMQKRTARRIGYMIMVVWAISFCVSVAPMLGWKDSQFHCRVEVRYECLISQDPSYQIFSTTTAFYGPLVLICILYWKIYKAAQRRIQMQVKRRSNTTVAQIRAKIIALQQQEQEHKEAASSAERGEVEESETAYETDYGRKPSLANGRLAHNRQSLKQKKSNVQIRLIQPSSNEPTAAGPEPELSTAAQPSCGLTVSARGTPSSFYSLSDIDDDSPENTAIVTTSTLIRTKSEDIEDQPSTEVLNAVVAMTVSSKRCNGNGPGTGGVITTGPDGSVDFSTEDEAEYIDDWHTPSPRIIERKRTSSSGDHFSLPTPQPVCGRTPKCSTATAATAFSSPRGQRASTFSQSEFTSTTFTGPAAVNAATAVVGQKRSRFKSKKESAESSRERRAGRTLAIITGIFVVSWLPFFILALIRPLCGAACAVPKPVDSVFAWLGYVNSAINPVIYTIFSPDFRNAFKRTLKRFCLVRRN